MPRKAKRVYTNRQTNDTTESSKGITNSKGEQPQTTKHTATGKKISENQNTRKMVTRGRFFNWRFRQRSDYRQHHSNN